MVCKLNTLWQHKQTNAIYTLVEIQDEQRAKHGQVMQWIIMHNPRQKYPISVEMKDFKADYVLAKAQSDD